MLSSTLTAFLPQFIFAFVASATLIPLFSKIAGKSGAVARVYAGPFRQPKGIPLFGGAAMGVVIISGALFFKLNGASYLLLCSAPILITGLLDDFTELMAQPKFIGQFLGA